MRALVILPTYNEIENLPRIVPQILEVDPDLEVLVVDDDSPDGTGKEADRMAEVNPRLSVIHRASKMGLGSAYITGFKYGIEKGFDYLFEMDADFSHDAKYLKDFLREIKEADLVVGSRYLQGVNVINWPMSRLLLSYFANVYTRIITGLPLRDATGGFKCYRREALEAIELDSVRSDGYSFQIEMSFKLWRKGFRLKEIPIIFYDRQQGESKMSKKIVREAVWMVWRLGLERLFGREDSAAGKPQGSSSLQRT
ncbi:MAG: polyprenol monophosphomannose synthase [Candidatus Zixiibacteriota bacterium]|nr:MAG: polyprenol monophosphomannose synthase [candidate division Zixibacteria bacterium]